MKGSASALFLPAQVILTIRMSLDFCDHLSQAPHGPVATLLWHLLLEVVLRSLCNIFLGLASLILHLAGPVLGLIRHVLLSLGLECINTSAGTFLGSSGGIEVAGCLVIGRRNILSMTNACVLSGSGGVLDISARERLVLCVL